MSFITKEGEEGLTFLDHHLNTIVTVVCLVVTGLFWVGTMNGIPKRVDKLEAEMEEVKTQMTKADAKTDIILEDTKFIKQIVIQKNIKG